MDLRDLIREARRELRRASGVPLTAEEQAEKQRTLEIARMQKFLHEALGVRIMFSLLPRVIWTEEGATARFTVESQRFQNYKDGDRYRLFDTGGDGMAACRLSFNPKLAARDSKATASSRRHPSHRTSSLESSLLVDAGPRASRLPPS